jgi:hypothetical protein
MKAILLGASNAWFPITLSSLFIPTTNGKLASLVEQHWGTLTPITTKEILAAFRQTPLLRPFSLFTDEEIWDAIQHKRNVVKKPSHESELDLKTPEWLAFTNPGDVGWSQDFALKEKDVPSPFRDVIQRVVMVERIREVRALIGFTRIESPGDPDDVGGIPKDKRAPLSRKSPIWVPAAEVRGEGIFLQFREDALAKWISGNTARESDFLEAHKQWRKVRDIKPQEAGFPGLRYVLLHSFSHALMRQIAMECGYAAASIRERLYSRSASGELPAMAGILLYTGASDSEGTLGGLSSLAEPNSLLRHIDQALEQMTLCASDPLCTEHHPHKQGITLHGAACHACLFAPETSCERGNKYLDRCVLVNTLESSAVPFFR